jgi:hypothetical protein
VVPLALYGFASVMPGSNLEALAGVIVGSIAACTGLGAWLMSTREPGRTRGQVLESCVRVVGVVATVAMVAFGYMITTRTPVGEWYDWVPTIMTAAGAVLGICEPLIMRRILGRTPGRPETWSTWLSQAAGGIAWGIMFVGVSTNLLDRQRWAMMFALLLCVIPPAVAARVWWVLRPVWETRGRGPDVNEPALAP